MQRFLLSFFGSRMGAWVKIVLVLIAILANIWIFEGGAIFLGLIFFWILLDRVFLRKDEVFFRVLFSLITYFGIVSLANATVFAGHKGDFIVRVLTNTSWAWFQELILLGFFAAYVQWIFDKKSTAAITVSAIFFAVHLPNLFLAAVTAIFGFFIANLFYHLGLRAIYLTAPLHSLLAVLIKIYLPFSLHHNLRIGWDYFR